MIGHRAYAGKAQDHHGPRGRLGNGRREPKHGLDFADLIRRVDLKVALHGTDEREVAA